MYSLRFITFALLFVRIAQVHAEDYFNPLFLGSDVASLHDLSFISKNNNVTPGVYYFDVYVGDKFIKNSKIRFVEVNSKEKKVEPCFTSELVDLMPFNDSLKKKLRAIGDNSKCIDLQKNVSGSSYQVEMSKLLLRISIPQIYLDATRSSLADVRDWDDGIPVFISNYDFTGSNSKNTNNSNFSSSYFSFNNKLNYGAWRFNGNIYWNQSHYGVSHHNEKKINNVFASRAIQGLKSNLIIGQNSLGSNLFDSLTYTGVTLATSEEMRPESERGYSPPIKGIADSRSKLTIRQNGVIVYQTYVDAGPYDIKDLNPVGSSGDYQVELIAADGTVKNFIIPYSTLPNLLKTGLYNYSATAGELDLQAARKASFFQGSASFGLPHETTIYGGTQLSGNYRSLGLGLAKDLGGIGALSFDAINSYYTEDAHDKEVGQSYRVLYSKSFQDIGTNIQITGYRYSTSNYYSLNEAVQKDNNQYIDPLTGESVNYNYSGARKASYQWNISQNLNNFGQLSLWGNTTDYWNGGTSKNIQAGWNKTFNKLNNMMLSLSFNKYEYNKTKNNLFFVSFTIPLSGRGRNNIAYISNSYTYNKQDGAYNNNTSLYGTALDNRMDYNINQSINREHDNNTTYLSANYRSDYARFKSGLTFSPVTKQADYGVSGSILAHENGIVFSQQANDTAILVEAAGASGARINRAGENITIDKHGYALIPYASPYHYNDVELDPLTFGDDFDVEGRVIKVAPTRGAVSKVVFDVKRGYNFLVSVKYKNKPIRFGTIVSEEGNNSFAIANDDGTVYLTGVSNNATYKVKWDDEDTCKFVIHYDENFKSRTINRTQVECH